MMSGAKSKEVEKKFAQISPETVNLIAESLGMGGGGGQMGGQMVLDSRVTRALAEDASYRCRELVNIASKILKHSKRRRLTVQDLDTALDLYDADPVLGHKGHDSSSSCQGYHVMPDVSKGSGNEQPLLFVPEERLIELRPFALGQSPPVVASEPDVKAAWLSLEGHYFPEGEEQKPVDFPKKANITPALANYYTEVTKIILGDSDQLFRMIIDDIRTNSKIGPLLPFLVCFIRTGMQRYCEKKTLIFRLLSLLQAVFSNTSLNLSPKPYLSHLVTALLSSLIVDRNGRNDQQRSSSGGGGGLNNSGGGMMTSSDSRSGGGSTTWLINMDHVQLASTILRQVLERWATPVNQLRSQTHSALRVYLTDATISHTSHYGALSAMIALGAPVLDECLAPHIQAFIHKTEEKMARVQEEAASSKAAFQGREIYENSRKKAVLNLMWGTLVFAVRSLIRHYNSCIGSRDSSPTSTSSSSDPTKIAKFYQLVVEHFGDSLCMCPPPPPPSTTTRHHSSPASASKVKKSSERNLRENFGRLRMRKFGKVQQHQQHQQQQQQQQHHRQRRPQNRNRNDVLRSDLSVVPIDIFDGLDEDDEDIMDGVDEDEGTVHVGHDPFRTTEISASVRQWFPDSMASSTGRTVQLYKPIRCSYPPDSLRRARGNFSIHTFSINRQSGNGNGSSSGGWLAGRMGTPRGKTTPKEISNSCDVYNVL